MVRASMDAECNVSMDAHAPLGMPGLAGKLTVHQGKNDLIQGTALYYGERKLPTKCVESCGEPNLWPILY